MGTIANQKNGGMVQLELQGIGTSETSIMLQQPLLGTSSDDYTVEVTQLMMSLGEERAMSGTEYVMAVLDRPDDGIAFDLDAYHTSIYTEGMSETEAYLKMINAAGANPAVDSGSVNSIANVKCYSATDFIYMINNQLGILFDDFSLTVSPSGQFGFSGSHDFWENYCILIGPLLQALSGSGDFICGSGPGLITMRENTTLLAFTAVDQPHTFHGKINESAWEVFDRRKRIRIDLSIPVGLTLGWKDTEEVLKYSVQEFYLPKGEPRATYEDSGVVTIKQAQLIGTTEFVDGGGKLAIKKLLPGPVQAIRLSLILIYEYFAPIKKVWVEKEKPVSMSSGDFFYLKLQFNKATT